MKKYFFADNKNGEGKEGKYHGEGKIVAGRVEGPIRIISGMIRL